MSVSAMKCALQSLESVEKVKGWNKDSIVGRHCTQSAHFLRQAIAEAEKQEPVAWFGDADGFPVYAAPVHASDISQEPVDETAKDQHEFEEMVKRGTKAWDGTPDDWVDDLRGGADKQDPDDDIYDVWVEQGTSQENRQVAMRRTTRDEKIVNPGVYEVPLFDCPRCGHCCREWVGLTDEEIEDIYEQEGRADVVLLTQAKLKEKNT